MQKGVLPHRAHYEQSGRIGWEFFGLVIPVSAAAAILLAAMLTSAQYVGFYFAAYAACIAACPLCALGWWGVRVGRCRNTFVAGLYGVLSGALMYFGHYYLDLIASNGFRKFEPPQALVDHIAFYLQHVRWQRVGEWRDPPGPIPTVNAVVFGAEFFLVAVISAIGAVRMSRNVFCERTRTWAERSDFSLRPGLGHFLYELVDHGVSEECPDRFELIAVKNGDRFCEVVIETCPEASVGEYADTYLSVREVDVAGRYENRSDEGFLVRQCRLSPHELQDLQRRFAATQAR